MSWKGRPIEVRFWEKVDRSGGPDACWPWLAAKTPKGYGVFPINFNGGSTYPQAHRTAWQLTHHGPLPQYPLVMDHVCKRRDCVNPAHLRIVTQAENCGPLARPTPFEFNRTRTECNYGHPFSPENTHWYFDSRGVPTRMCIACYAAKFPGTKKYPNTRETAYQRKPQARVFR